MGEKAQDTIPVSGNTWNRKQGAECPRPSPHTWSCVFPCALTGTWRVTLAATSLGQLRPRMLVSTCVPLSSLLLPFLFAQAAHYLLLCSLSALTHTLSPWIYPLLSFWPVLPAAVPERSFLLLNCCFGRWDQPPASPAQRRLSASMEGSVSTQ